MFSSADLGSWGSIPSLFVSPSLPIGEVLGGAVTLPNPKPMAKAPPARPTHGIILPGNFIPPILLPHPLESNLTTIVASLAKIPLV